jgi:predicted esterase
MRLSASLTAVVILALVGQNRADAQTVHDIRAVHRHGQTFVTWKDLAQGEEGSRYRYSLYRSGQPITNQNLAQAELCYHGVLNNSARLYGTAFNMKDRIDPAKPYSVIEDRGQPLPPWSGLGVVTIPLTPNPSPARGEGRRSYYAIMATDVKLKPVSQIAPGQSATTESVEEKPGPIQPIKLYDSKERKGPYVANTSITGKKGLPLHVTLHGSQAGGGGAGEYGDYYLFFGTPDMGYRDGLPGVFSVTETRDKAGNHLVLRPRDALEHPSGLRAMETYWFGYWCVPQGAKHAEPRVYPFTENQLTWMVRWTAERYGADPNRITMGGSSSGAVGSMNVGFRHPELFAAVFPTAGRVRKVPAIALESKLECGAPALMSDGKTSYHDHVDGPRFAAQRNDDLPFLVWACGRHDGYATWQEHIDMVKALTDARHGFAFSWNNGGHGDGGKAMQALAKHYPAAKFARNQSYPALGNSSLNHKMGNGDPKDGDLIGGINLGFDWQDVFDEADRLAVTLSNDLAKTDMTVDVTPRRCQQFKPRPGDQLRWTSSTGGSGTVTADQHGLVTVPSVVIQAGKGTRLMISSGK